MDPAVGLVSAYLELCGYFVLAELPVREAEGEHYRDVTDLDIVAVRFPYPSAEVPADPFALLLGSDSDLRTFEDGVDVIIGEVKEGAPSINPALRGTAVIAFALRRLGCCPPHEIPARALSIARRGRAEMQMAPGLQCRVRLVAFAGKGDQEARSVLTIPLAHCAAVIRRSLSDAESGFAFARWKDPTLGLMALLAKVTPDVTADSQL